MWVESGDTELFWKKRTPQLEARHGRHQHLGWWCWSSNGANMNTVFYKMVGRGRGQLRSQKEKSRDKWVAEI